MVAAPTSARYLGTFRVTEPVPYLGGFSGFAISADGTRFTVLSDSAALASGTIVRDPAGAVAGVTFDGPPLRLKGADGAMLDDPEDDSEGLAAAGDGTFFISFELDNRVAHYGPHGQLIETLPVPEAFAAFEYNAGPETVARAPDGGLWLIPEGDTGGFRRMPVFHFRDGVWSQPFTLPSDGTWRPVDAAFGPDGQFYLLERDFWPLVGFMSRLRRFSFGSGGPTGGEVLFQSPAGRHGNLEGLGLWTDGHGVLHATMVTDNNFLSVQDSAFVDYALPE